MAYRKYLIMAALLMQAFVLKAQQDRYALADSVSKNYYQAGQWKQLIDAGNTALAAGTDFTLLRHRMAYAYFALADYKGALAQYDHILSADHNDAIALYYAYYCNVYLNNDLSAAVNAGYMDSLTRSKEGVKKYALTSVGIEGSVKLPQNSNRRGGIYSRIGLGSRVGWRLQLDQSAAYFYQQIYVPEINGNSSEEVRPENIQTVNNDGQFEYYLKARYAVNSKLALLGSYHYLNTTYLGNVHNGHVGLLGISYSGGRYTDLQADVNMGSVFSSHLAQYNAQVTFYPYGNLQLYTISRGSLKNYNKKNQFVLSQSLGFKLTRKIWFEGNVTLGTLENYIDADGLYIYNAVDNTTFKTGGTFFYQLYLHAMLQINYTYETKYDIYKLTNYGQHSVTAGLAWKF